MLWEWWLLADEPIGAVLGLFIVWCLIRQNMWAWPLGVIYVLVSITVLFEAKLYANLALHVAGFLPMNLYGWYYWLFGKEEDQDVLPVTRSSWQMLTSLAVSCGIGTIVLGTIFTVATDAALPFWDNGIFVGSLAAMWLTARKKIENWSIWFVIDVLSVGVYYAQGLTWYALLYFIYLGMAVAGYVSWLRSMEADATPLNDISTIR
jgi:nicotinamide mononucleotide transporter